MYAGRFDGAKNTLVLQNNITIELSNCDSSGLLRIMYDRFEIAKFSLKWKIEMDKYAINAIHSIFSVSECISVGYYGLFILLWLLCKVFISKFANGPLKTWWSSNWLKCRYFRVNKNITEINITKNYAKWYKYQLRRNELLSNWYTAHKHGILVHYSLALKASHIGDVIPVQLFSYLLS